MKRILIFLIADLVLVACVPAASSTPTLRASEAVVPTPTSLLVESFVWQTDGVFGYRMLRPAKWQPTAPFDGRSYGTPDFQNTADRIILKAINLKAYYKSGANANGVIVQLDLFEKDSSLAGWTRGIEQMWKSNGIESILLRTLPQAKIYSVTSPDASDVRFVAYVVDKDQPLAVSLTASGIYADRDRLQKEGVVDDFVTVVTSAQAIPQDPHDVDPPLPRQ
jgi:hypothetical protein